MNRVVRLNQRRSAVSEGGSFVLLRDTQGCCVSFRCVCLGFRTQVNWLFLGFSVMFGHLLAGVFSDLSMGLHCILHLDWRLVAHTFGFCEILCGLNFDLCHLHWSLLPPKRELSDKFQQGFKLFTNVQAVIAISSL